MSLAEHFDLKTSYYKMRFKPDPDHYSTTFGTTKMLPIVECGKCQNCYGYVVAYDFDPKEMAMDIQDIDLSDGSISGFRKICGAIRPSLKSFGCDIEILPGGFFPPVEWRTKKEKTLHYYRSPLLVHFDHISAEMHDEIRTKAFKGFLTFAIEQVLIDDQGNELSRRSNYYGVILQNCLRQKVIEDRLCAKCEFIRNSASKTLPVEPVSPIETLPQSDIWYVDEVGRICSERFRTLCIDLGATNISFQSLSDEDCQSLLLCNEWYKFGAVFSSRKNHE